MTTTRLLLGPVIVILAATRCPGILIAACILTGLASDIFDGILARRLNVATEFLRRYDSASDTVLYVGVAVGAWILYPQILQQNAISLGSLIALEMFRHLLDWIKFGRTASYHSWFAKAWGLVLATATMALFAFGATGLLLQTAVIMGIGCNLECVAMSLILRKWRHDVPTLWHALRLRREDAALTKAMAAN
jgi:CDP-diacylglycerol--glycerol-3-phosphate 3-phosphatidyltransferase